MEEKETKDEFYKKFIIIIVNVAFLILFIGIFTDIIISITVWTYSPDYFLRAEMSKPLINYLTGIEKTGLIGVITCKFVISGLMLVFLHLMFKAKTKIKKNIFAILTLALFFATISIGVMHFFAAFLWILW